MPRQSDDKKPKDMNAPKKPQTSYFLYSNERRAPLQKETGKSVTEISKYISAEWKEMEPDTKKTYDERAQVLKKEYNTVMDEYKQSDNYRTYQAKLKEWQQLQKDKAKGGSSNDSDEGTPRKSPRKKSKNPTKPPKKPKQPEEMPRRPASAYFVFSNSRRNELKDQYPDKKVTELATLIGGEWKLKTEDEKKVYEAQAKVLKAEYEETMKTYKETGDYKRYILELDEWKQAKKRFDKGLPEFSDDEEGIKVALPRKPKCDKMPKRPLTSYFLFAQAVREQVKSEFPNLAVTQIAKEISNKWKAVTEEDKKPYAAEAARLKGVYEKAMAVYKESGAHDEYQKQLDGWKAECAKRRTDAKRKDEKKKAAAAASPKKKPASKKAVKNGKNGKKGKAKKKMDTDSDDSGSESGSSSSGSSGSDSDSSGSSSSGSSGSGSDSDSD